MTSFVVFLSLVPSPLPYALNDGHVGLLFKMISRINFCHCESCGGCLPSITIWVFLLILFDAKSCSKFNILKWLCFIFFWVRDKVDLIFSKNICLGFQVPILLRIKVRESFYGLPILFSGRKSPSCLLIINGNEETKNIAGCIFFYKYTREFF